MWSLSLYTVMGVDHSTSDFIGKYDSRDQFKCMIGMKSELPLARSGSEQLMSHQSKR